MAATPDALGRLINVVHEASGKDIPLTDASAVTFVSFLDAGTHTLTFTQTDSTGTNSEIDLNVFDLPATPVDAKSRIYAGAGVGGTWVDVTASASADNVADGADGTNDCYVVTIRAEQLADGYDRVQCTASAGTCVAILHELKTQRKPGNLRSSLTA